MNKFFLSSFAVFFLYGCSQDSETYERKIQRYENKISTSAALQYVEQASNLIEKENVESSFETFRDFPIPEGYKEIHNQLGLDTTEFAYVVDGEIGKIKADLVELEMLRKSMRAGQMDHTH